MRRFVPVALLLGLFVAGACISAKDNEPKYKTAEVKKFTKADGVDLTQDYLNAAYAHLRDDLQKTNLFGAVVEDGGTVADADAADSVIVQCNVLDFTKAHFPVIAMAHVDVTIYRRSDHSVLQHTTAKVGWQPNSNDDMKGKLSSGQITAEIKKLLK
ncbi:MAG: hypothetical protein ACLP1Y_16745 [Candidatus Acidiferrales bacterium]